MAFRDPLQAARARIAALEEEVARLRGAELEEARQAQAEAVSESLALRAELARLGSEREAARVAADGAAEAERARRDAADMTRAHQDRSRIAALEAELRARRSEGDAVPRARALRCVLMAACGPCEPCRTLFATLDERSLLGAAAEHGEAWTKLTLPHAFSRFPVALPRGETSMTCPDCGNHLSHDRENPNPRRGGYPETDDVRYVFASRRVELP